MLRACAKSWAISLPHAAVYSPCGAAIRWLSASRDEPVAETRAISPEAIEAANEELRAGLDAFVDGGAADGSPDVPAPISTAQAGETREAASPRPPDHSEGFDLGPQLTHVDAKGRATMVDVSEKPVSVRTAVASAVVHILSEHPVASADAGAHADAAADASNKSQQQRRRHLMAQLAGIKAAKMTSMLIPLCHNLLLSKVGIELHANEAGNEVQVTATVTTKGQTGVEMEAMTAATFAAICLLHLMKGVGPGQGRLSNIQLESKTGGRSGRYLRPLQSPLCGEDAAEGSPPAGGAASSSSSSSFSATAAAAGAAADAPGPGPGLPPKRPRSQARRTQGSPLLDLMSDAHELATFDARLQGATAVARLSMPPLTWQQVVDNVNKKGDVLEVSRLAGIMAADLTGLLVPGTMGGNEHLLVDAHLATSRQGHVEVRASAAALGRQPVGVAAYTAAAVAALTVYDMCKASSKSTVIEEISLRET